LVLINEDLEMHLSDADFDAALDWVVQSTTNVVNKQEPSCYFMSVFLITGGEITVQTLVEESERGNADPYDVLHEFGRHMAKEGRRADAVFIANQETHEKGSTCIAVSGCARDGRTNAAELVVLRKHGRLQITQAHAEHCSGRDSLRSQRTLAGELMRELVG
jgi:hypothetical protein